MRTLGISFGNPVGGVAFLASIATDIVELSFEDNEMKKEGRETLFVLVNQYEDFEEITVASRSLFGMYIDSDTGLDEEREAEATIACFAEEFNAGSHGRMNDEINKSPFASEIKLARYAMDLFKKEQYGPLAGLYGKEADETMIPEVDYDRAE